MSAEACTHPEEDRTNWGDGKYGCGQCGATPSDLAWQAYIKRAQASRAV